MVTKEIVYKHLRDVIDPELGINIVDLGLIYEVVVKEKDVFITMTLTFPGCPLGGIIKNEVDSKLAQIDGLGKVNLTITFDPPWNLSMISPEARAEIGI
jgi:metal-sulfur cluster biosynthetic enzyme